MSDTLRFTILGCGSSGGVPRVGGHWGACDPADPRNRRRRCSLLVEREGAEGTTRVLIDASPDLRDQLLDAGVGTLDAVVFTHPHADHCHGLDDLRMVVFNRRARLPVWADTATQVDLFARFRYAFETPEGSSYPPILEMNTIERTIAIDGAGGRVTLDPFRVGHGNIDALGFRIGGLAYLPDAGAMTEEAWRAVEGIDVWIVDALRRDPHPSHSHLARTLDWIARAEPKRAILTDMHNDLDYATLDAETPANVTPAHDGMTLCLPAP
ncbi:phosphoribosyl 1,2-cyclic phosphate phosphodiesterase [Palleronia aestuarii]|uniref:Phosphoribosyl 1,2-cyclic phosphate phosphodiesterase n=1 Tax=Palleronia aestuarii TaxID=568105 RepID=A0A2W7Q7T7_9RHOB|nr:MBL fold metallo-hydrolase [Palleronia aestuarii]PZX17809.1 phosphoribosyl 1,2-cyclic phosphate phosphodiesterase [Palleronia aestuarii]